MSVVSLWLFLFVVTVVVCIFMAVLCNCETLFCRYFRSLIFLLMLSLMFFWVYFHIFLLFASIWDGFVHFVLILKHLLSVCLWLNLPGGSGRRNNSQICVESRGQGAPQGSGVSSLQQDQVLTAGFVGYLNCLL